MYLGMVYYFVTYYPYRNKTLACQVLGEWLHLQKHVFLKSIAIFLLFFYNILFRTLITIFMCTVFALSGSIVVIAYMLKKKKNIYHASIAIFASLPVWSFSQSVDLKECLNYLQDFQWILAKYSTLSSALFVLYAL